MATFCMFSLKTLYIKFSLVFLVVAKLRKLAKKKNTAAKPQLVQIHKNRS